MRDKAAYQKAYREANKDKVKMYSEKYIEKRRRKQKPSRMNAVELPMPDKLLDNLDVPLTADQMPIFKTSAKGIARVLKNPRQKKSKMQKKPA